MNTDNSNQPKPANDKLHPSDLGETKDFNDLSFDKNKQSYEFDVKGEDKDYGMNENFDYFNIKGTKGTRTKVMAQLDGTFLTTDTFEDVSVRFKGDQVFLDYKTDYAKWSEELISISEETFVVKNDQNKEYHYKKAGPVNILNDGKETK